MKLMLCLMSQLEKLVSFEGIQSAVYFARFSRWLIQELLAECATKFQQWDRSPESAMDAQDGHVLPFNSYAFTSPEHQHSMMRTCAFSPVQPESRAAT